MKVREGKTKSRCLNLALTDKSFQTRDTKKSITTHTKLNSTILYSGHSYPLATVLFKMAKKKKKKGSTNQKQLFSFSILSSPSDQTKVCLFVSTNEDDVCQKGFLQQSYIPLAIGFCYKKSKCNLDSRGTNTALRIMVFVGQLDELKHGVNTFCSQSRVSLSIQTTHN